MAGLRHVDRLRLPVQPRPRDERGGARGRSCARPRCTTSASTRPTWPRSAGGTRGGCSTSPSLPTLARDRGDDHHQPLLGRPRDPLLLDLRRCSRSSAPSPPWRAGRPGTSGRCRILMFFSVVFLVVETPRYRTAIDPFIVLLATAALVTAARRALASEVDPIALRYARGRPRRRRRRRADGRFRAASCLGHRPVAGGSCRRTRPQTPQAPSEGRVPRHPPEDRLCPAGRQRSRRGPRASTPSRPQLLRRAGAPVLSAGVSRHRGRPPRWRANGALVPPRTADGHGRDALLTARRRASVSTHAGAEATAVILKSNRCDHCEAASEEQALEFWRSRRERAGANDGAVGKQPSNPSVPDALSDIGGNARGAATTCRARRDGSCHIPTPFRARHCYARWPRASGGGADP